MNSRLTHLTRPHPALRRTALALAALGLVALAACNRADPQLGTAPVAGTTPPVVVAAAPVMPTDMEITSRVKGSLMGDALIGSQTIEVDTTAGEVRLRGMVDTQAQKDQALLVARAVTGVREVQDELTLKP